MAYWHIGFFIMEQQEITPEVLKRVKTLERINWESYLKLIENGTVKRTRKLKKPRTIFYDEDGDCLVYLNPFLRQFQCCAIFVNDIDKNI